MKEQNFPIYYDGRDNQTIAKNISKNTTKSIVIKPENVEIKPVKFPYYPY